MALSVFALVFTAACTPTNTAAPPVATATDAPSMSEQYLIGVSDQLAVSVWQHADLSVTVPVRPDGRITVPLVGDVTVGGLAPEAVAETITKALATYVRDPQVTVIVVGINSVEYENRVRVTGAVRAPRSVPFRRSMTVLDVVLESGGVSEFAEADRTVLYRIGGERLNVDLEAILERGDLTTNYALRPGDVVTVPEQRF